MLVSILLCVVAVVAFAVGFVTGWFAVRDGARIHVAPTPMGRVVRMARRPAPLDIATALRRRS